MSRRVVTLPTFHLHSKSYFLLGYLSPSLLPNGHHIDTSCPFLQRNQDRPTPSSPFRTSFQLPKLSSRPPCLVYFPYRAQLVIRMPGPLHEGFLALVRRDLESQLLEIQTVSDPALQTVPWIMCGGSPDLVMVDGGKHTPDTVFGYERALYPGLVIEVAHSQSRKRKGKDLALLAHRYIAGSLGKINRVIGLSVSYPVGMRGTISVWGPVWSTTGQGSRRMEVMELVGPDVCLDLMHR